MSPLQLAWIERLRGIPCLSPSHGWKSKGMDENAALPANRMATRPATVPTPCNGRTTTNARAAGEGGYGKPMHERVVEMPRRDGTSVTCADARRSGRFPRGTQSQNMDGSERRRKNSRWYAEEGSNDPSARPRSAAVDLGLRSVASPRGDRRTTAHFDPRSKTPSSPLRFPGVSSRPSRLRFQPTRAFSIHLSTTCVLHRQVWISPALSTASVPSATVSSTPLRHDPRCTSPSFRISPDRTPQNAASTSIRFESNGTGSTTCPWRATVPWLGVVPASPSSTTTTPGVTKKKTKTGGRS